MTGVLRRAALTTCLSVLTTASAALAQSDGRVGLRAGAGADVSGGVAFGGQLDYTLFQGENSFELGLLGFYASAEEESSNGFNDYFETTDITVAAAIGNYLFRHSLESGGPYFVAGAGVGAIYVAWREESPTDTSLGPPLPGGGSFQEEDGTAAGFILNFGIGQRFNEQVDLRASVPTFFIGEGEERESSVVPTLTITLGIGF